jgi:hypothetical protein
MRPWTYGHPNDFGRGPSEGDLIGGSLGRIAGFAVGSGTVQCPDSIRFELDDELLNDMLDRFTLAVRNFDEGNRYRSTGR